MNAIGSKTSTELTQARAASARGPVSFLAEIHPRISEYPSMPNIKRPQLKMKHMDEVLQQFSNAQSDREVAILAGGFLEGMLYDFLKQMIVESPLQSAESLFSYPRPMSSFAGMASMSFAFGMLSEREFRNISIIRNVRNFFAHSLGLEGMDQASFKSDSIRKLLQEFDPNPVLEEVAEEHLKEIRAGFIQRTKKDPRGAFVQIFADTVLLVLGRFRTLKKRTAPTDADYEPGIRGAYVRG